MQGSRRAGLIAVSGIALTLAPASALAQEEPERCIVLCAPTLKLEPTLTIENLLQRHRVRDAATGETVRAERSAELEMILALDIPTTIPRVSFTFEAIWAPFAAGSSSASTGAGGAAEESDIRENGVELEFELNLHVLPSTRTGGWLGAHFDIIDKYSSAERPGEGSEYTHKLNFELDVGVTPFNFLERGWLRRLELETSLDYVATGLPRAGDVGRLGEEQYLDDASPWSLSFVLVLPVAPLGG